MTYLLLFGVFFILLFLGAPICMCLGLSSVLALLHNGTSLTVVASSVYAGIAKYLLLAVPFFVLSGNIMARAGISRRLIAFVDACCGHIRGGIAVVCVVVACFFGAISGSGAATVAALGVILVPAMIDREGFDPPFATGIMAAASSIAIIIPPSISFVVYASITGASVGDLFMAGIIPGILMGLALIVIVEMKARKDHLKPSHGWMGFRNLWDTFRDAVWGLLMPVIILGGIYGGIFSATEAAAVAVVYGLFVGVFIYKELDLKALAALFVDTAKTTGGLMLIVGAAGIFSYACTAYGISTGVQNLLLNGSGNRYVFLLIVNIVFLVAGCFVDANSAMYIFIPIMTPVAKAFGIDLIHFGIIATVNLAIGQVTPPVGMNLFVATGLRIDGHKPVTIAEISRAVVPMILSALVVLLLVTYVEGISMCLIA
ncbi:TRAP transporter large permease [Dysosmobacter sp.]|uniref:TRAP transporter large permease n=1 Tax=Dysosmobacter sp. TaxID=2591382 RepID=UPI002A87F194|nr:TRAP transporter large permease [Dysosmobacter sp.]MDY3282760.1 TRAP transporter large permease [Dysosmobacter sp.]